MLRRFFIVFQLVVAFTISSASTSMSLMETIGGEKQIQLKNLTIATDISGGMAKTTVRMEFYNPNGRQLEGNLQFPLLDGQQIIGFALDIDGKMRSAVPVEKAKGRQIFEEIERKNADPALLEKTQGNNFKLRVYPIQALKTRTVEVQYSEALKRDGKSYIYTLPLAYADQLKGFNLAIKVNGSTHAPKAIGTMGNVKFTKQKNSYQALITKQMYKPTGSLTLTLPASDQPQSYIQVHDGTTYFMSEVPLLLKHTVRELPKVIGVLWDSSGSARSRSIETELSVLDHYFKSVGNAEVRLTRLRDHSEATQTFNVVNGNWDLLRDTLKNTVYDGASALCDWRPQTDVNEYLLFSDGLSNYGTNLFPVLGKNQRLYTINSSLSADTGRLRALAQQNGGDLIRVDSNKPLEAVDALLKNIPNVDVLYSSASDVLVDTTNLQQGMVRISGKLTGSSTVSVVVEGRESDITFAVTKNSIVHPLAASMWAEKKLQSLEANYEINRGEIRRIGLNFGIPTRETSLIVLDRAEDYLRYDVTPPDELKVAFEGLKIMRDSNQKNLRKSHLDRVVSDFENKIAWWEKSYPKDAPPKLKHAESASSGVMDRMMTFISPPQPVATTMAMAPAPIAMSVADNMAINPTTDSLPEIGISLKKWRSDAPYIARMNAASADTIYAIYLDEKPSYENSSAFFLDAADMLMEKGEHDLALRVLSNLVEMDLENTHVLRILGYRLLQANAPDSAIPVFEKVLRLAEEEPQSYRDLGLAQAAAGNYQEAVNKLNEVVERPWENRFVEVELIAIAEMNAIIATATDHNKSVDVSRIDPRFLKNMPLDVRAVLTWDADNSDMDLWVTDPNGEKCYYGNRFTYQGGRMSRDFVGGYGPEEFSLRIAKSGKYRVEANFYGNRQQTVAGATTLQLKLTIHFGTSSANDQQITLRLKERTETVFVGEFEVK